MKIKLNSLLDDASGKFGDNIFARNPSGLYLRKHVEPDQPNTDRQMTIRDRFTAFSANWATLTEVQRTGWNGLAALVTKTGKYGDLYNPTGHRLYIALNQTRAEFALPEQSDAPAGIEGTIPLVGFAPTLTSRQLSLSSSSSARRLRLSARSFLSSPPNLCRRVEA